MVNIHTNEPFTGVLVGEETTWGTAASGTYYALPLVAPGESMAGRREQIQEPRAFGGTGGRGSVEYGRFTGGGAITVEGRYDSKGFNILLAHALWSEQVVTDVYVDGTTITAANSGNTHIYAAGATPPIGLTLQIWKAGVGPAASGFYDQFTGCMITKMSINQAQDTRVLFTFEFLSKAPTIVAGSGTLPAIGGAEIIKFRDLSRGAAYFKTGATLAAQSINTLEIVFDRKLVSDTPFATAPDTFDKPGTNDDRDVKATFTGNLEQDYAAAGKPYKEWVDKTQSKLDALYIGSTAVGNKTYAMRLECPRMDWDDGRNSLSDPGNPPTRFVGTMTALGAFDQTSGLPDGLTGDFRILMTVKTSDEPTPDAKFSSV